MDDQMLDLTDPADRLVGRMLRTYGEETLSPSIAATTRMRMSVMGVAHRRAALIEADATIGAAGATTAALAAKRAAAARTAWRRPVAAVLAGCLTLAVLSGTAFAARPGGPLYEARVWTEMANLPAGVVDRAQAEVHRLEQRIQEAQTASTAGDGRATQAALVAYSRIVVEAASGTDADPTAKAAIEITVTRHVVVLTLMVESVPAPARGAAEQALSSSTMALDDLEGAGAADPATAPDAEPASNPASDPGAVDRQQAEPGKVDEPARSGRHEDDHDLKPAKDRPGEKPEKPVRAP